MNKLEFLEALKIRLKKLPKSELDRVVNFYDESIQDRIDDGMPEEEAVLSMGSVDSVAEELSYDDSISSIIKEKIQDSHNKSSNKKVWIILAICGSPLWLPLLIALIAVIFSIYISIWAVIVSLCAAVFSFGVGGAGGIVSSFFMMMKNTNTGITMLGLSIACLGLFFLTVLPVFNLCKAIVTGTKLFFIKIKRKLTGKKESII